MFENNRKRRQVFEKELLLKVSRNRKEREKMIRYQRQKQEQEEMLREGAMVKRRINFLLSCLHISVSFIERNTIQDLVVRRLNDHNS
jgi:hypothetical protein